MTSMDGGKTCRQCGRTRAGRRAATPAAGANAYMTATECETNGRRRVWKWGRKVDSGKDGGGGGADVEVAAGEWGAIRRPWRQIHPRKTALW